MHFQQKWYGTSSISRSYWLAREWLKVVMSVKRKVYLWSVVQFTTGKGNIGRILSSHSGGYEEFYFLGYNAMDCTALHPRR
jgi:hypothetical protein